MKQNIYFSKFILFICLLTWRSQANAQITVTSSDSLTCTTLCTTLTAHLVGDTATNAGITSDDVYSSLIPIGFPFSFYGTSYTQVVIGANGTVGFTPSLAGASDPWPITAPLLGNPSKLNSICGPWCDIDIFYTGTPVGTETYAVIGTAPNRQFIISWCKCSMYSCGDQRFTSQIIMYESTNVIEVHLSQKEICTDWNPNTPPGAGGRGIIGVQNATGTAATVAPGRDWEPVWGATNEAWRFTPNSAGTDYTVTSIPYGPHVMTTATVYWYNVTDGTYMGIGNSELVCPTSPTLYKAVVLICGDTVSYEYLVSPVPPVVISIGGAIGSGGPHATTPVSICGASDATFTVFGLSPGSIDTITFNKDGVPQPPVIATVAADGTITITGLSAGTYDNIVARQGSCVTDPVGPVVIPQPPILFTIAPVNPIVCGATDGSLTLNGLYPSHIFTINYAIDGIAQPPYSTITDATGSITITGLPEGTYTNIIASYSTPCTSAPKGPILLEGPPPEGVNIVSMVNATECGKCNGSIKIRPIKPFSSDTISYIYNAVTMPSFVTVADADSTIYLPGLCAGSYYNYSIKIGKCITPVSGTAILIDPLLTAGFAHDSVLACHGDSVFFHNTSSSTGALYYLWSFGDGSSDTVTNPVHIYPAGNYTVHLTATNHYCNSEFVDSFKLGHPLKAVFTETPDILCQGQTAITTNSSIGATGYMWYFNNTASDTTTNATYTYQKAGTYDLTLVAHNNIPCYDTAHKTIYVDTISNLNITLTDSVTCSGTYVTMKGLYAALGNTGITWAFGDNLAMDSLPEVKHAYANQGTYTISATAHYRACPEASASRTVTVFQQPSIDIGRDTSICPGSEAIKLSDHINRGGSTASWLWNTGEHAHEITITAPGKYYATVNINNCYTSDSIEVANDCYVNIPNAFTPNGDGINDYFFPRQYLARGLTDFKMNIYNRWGQLLFETKSLDGNGWDGRLNGIDQPGGVYVYIIDASFKDGQQEHHQGNITLLR